MRNDQPNRNSGSGGGRPSPGRIPLHDEQQPCPYAFRGRHLRLLSATLVTNGRELPVRIRNISAGGAMVEGAGECREGASVILQLPRLGPVDGRIVWSRNGRAGVSFGQHVEPRSVTAPIGRARPPLLRPAN